MNNYKCYFHNLIKIYQLNVGWLLLLVAVYLTEIQGLRVSKTTQFCLQIFSDIPAHIRLILMNEMCLVKEK